MPPSESVKAFFRAANEGKYSLAEEYLSASAKDALKRGRGAEQGGIQGFCDTLTWQGRVESVDILSEKLRGEGAELEVKVRYKNSEERQFVQSMVRERDRWKLNSRPTDPAEEARFGGVAARVQLAKALVLRNGSIAKALEMYKFDMGKYPDTDEGLAALFQTKDKKKEDERYNGPYLMGAFEQLTDPWGNSFEYRSPGEVNKDSYDLWSRGPDLKDDGGKEGSDDIIGWIR